MKEQLKLMLLIEQGSEQAFDEFMTMHSQRLYNYAYGILGSHEQAEEVVSDVFLEVWMRRKKLLDIEKPESWLTTVTYHKAISYLRKEMKHKNDVDIDTINDFQFPQMQTPIDSIINNEGLARLNTAIEQLPNKCKHVFYLAKIEQMPYAEIAKMLNISIPTVNYHISYAMGSLKKIFAK